MFVKQSSNPYKIRKKIYKHFYKQNKYQQFAGIFSFAKQLVEEKIMGNVYVQKRGKVYQYQFAIASIDGKRKYKNKSGFRTKSEAIEAGVKAYNEYINVGHCIESSKTFYSDYLDYWIKEY